VRTALNAERGMAMIRRRLRDWSMPTAEDAGDETEQEPEFGPGHGEEGGS
jgi:hypothetical protein